MKPIRVLTDEPLLGRLDAEVKRVGRSEVLRSADAQYLRRSRIRKTAEVYRRAYGGGEGLGEEWAGWEDEGSWPDK